MSHPSLIGTLTGISAKLPEHEVVERAWAILDQIGVSARVRVSSLRVSRFKIAPGHVVRARAMQLHGARGEALLVRDQLLKHQQKRNGVLFSSDVDRAVIFATSKKQPTMRYGRVS